MMAEQLQQYSRRRPYKLADGSVVPSVTTILGRFKPSDALMWWAWDQGRQGLDYQQTRGKAADAGTLAHAMAESWFHGRGQRLHLAADHEVKRKALTSFRAFLAWAEGARLRPATINGVKQIEVRMVSERHRYGGMCDAVQLGFDNSLHICDWKTSGGVYPDYLLQIAAYKELWDENFPENPITGGYHLVRFDKETAGFVHHYWPALEMVNSDGEVVSCFDQFLRLLECYQAEKTIKKLLK